MQVGFVQADAALIHLQVHGEFPEGRIGIAGVLPMVGDDHRLVPVVIRGAGGRLGYGDRGLPVAERCRLAGFHAGRLVVLGGRLE